MNDLLEQMKTKVDLHEDLVDFIEESDIFPMLKHPLIFHVPYFDGLNGMINTQYLHKKELAEKFLKENKLEAYVFLHERPYRVNTFFKIKDRFKDDEYWSTLNSMWTDSENIYQNKILWDILLQSKRDKKSCFMTEDDLKAFNKLPETITVYRGCTKGLNEDGYSYTTDKKQAMWFANRFDSQQPKVIERKVKKEEVFAFTNSRSENEIILLK